MLERKGIWHKCSACYKQYKKKEHLVEHMKSSYHSVHQPRCAVCQKHCKSFESLRIHLTGPLAKANCSRIFSDRGCDLCLKVFDSSNSLSKHREMCCLSAPGSLVTKVPPFKESQVYISVPAKETYAGKGVEAVAIDCEMVGGGSDGTLNLCGRVCLVDEDENIIFQTYVQPQIPVTNYRYEVTGLTEEHLRDAMSLQEVRNNILEILYNGESVGKVRLDGGKARLLVGHSLDHDLDCLKMFYPDHLLRDTATYRPLMKTNLVSHSLKYLTQTYLGYTIQTGVHDPYEDCVSVVRLYKRMRDQDHQMVEGSELQSTWGGFDFWKLRELEKKTPDELYEISRSNYRCWCLDLKASNPA
ncbi:RNA exonuclease 4 isoform X2 [Jatropha curcas]|uniref:RNA exonuclease 4 isoform X2 n=1 Tax=Jatropha curcas TaxID=180498 RepID=UPI0005FB0502|nr:RNA exonuclease 4 isoform X2 [Jatropha curcas]